MLSAISPATVAGPAGGQVAAGSATITQSGAVTTINQASQRAVINWNSFSVGANEAVRFNQPNSAAATLNRVTGRESSSILGSISANGQVYILNPNGVLFGQGAQVNVGGLVATSLGISDSNFMSGLLSFRGTANAGSVVNQGTINAAPGGVIALMAPLVSNSGTLSAPEGKVLLAAAEAVTLTVQDGSAFAYTLDKGSINALVDNGGLIQAGGGHVILTAKGVDAMSRAAVNHTGTIEAQTMRMKNGVVELLADMESGTVTVAGKIDASAPNGGNGGFVETSGAQVKIAPVATVTTLAPRGQAGEWLIDPRDYKVAASGGDITGAQLSANLAGSNITLHTAQSSQGAASGNGDIFVNDNVSWSANRLTLTAARSININAVMNATGTAALTLNTSTANGADAAVAGGTVNVGSGGRVNFDRTGTGFYTVNGLGYTVINSLGAQGSTTGTDLQGIQGNLSGRYALGTDIAAGASAGFNSGAGFAPITNFTGVLDGLGHTVSGLTINRPTQSTIGLIGTASAAATVRNLNLTGVSIAGRTNVGALIGSNSGLVHDVSSAGTVSANNSPGTPLGGLIGTNSGTVRRASSSGTVRDDGQGGYIGGLIGFHSSGTVANSFSTATVNGTKDYHAGGLVGSNQAAIVESYATGNVTGNTAVGGLVGLNYSTGTITRSYASGNVTSTGISTVAVDSGAGGLIGQMGSDFVSGGGSVLDSYATGNVTNQGFNSPGITVIHRTGGLVGLATSSVSIRNSYATGAVSGQGAFLGGLLAHSLGGTHNFTGSFWDTQTTGQSTSAGGVGKTTAQMKTGSTFTNAGWDFANTWQINAGAYPVLRAMNVAAAGTTTNSATAPVTPDIAPTIVAVYTNPPKSDVVDLAAPENSASNRGLFSNPVADWNLGQTALENLYSGSRYFGQATDNSPRLLVNHAVSLANAVSHTNKEIDSLVKNIPEDIVISEYSGLTMKEYARNLFMRNALSNAYNGSVELGGP